MVTDQEKMMEKVCNADGFIAALDQSGGSSKWIYFFLLSIQVFDDIANKRHLFAFFYSTQGT